MNVTIEKCGDELIAALAGEIDHHNSKQIREAIDAELERGGYKLLTFDLESVSFMDSSGLGLILGRFTLCRELGTQFKLLSPSAEVMKILDLAGTERLIKIETRSDAQSNRKEN